MSFYLSYCTLLRSYKQLPMCLLIYDAHGFNDSVVYLSSTLQMGLLRQTCITDNEHSHLQHLDIAGELPLIYHNKLHFPHQWSQNTLFKDESSPTSNSEWLGIYIIIPPLESKNLKFPSTTGLQASAPLYPCFTLSLLFLYAYHKWYTNLISKVL